MVRYVHCWIYFACVFDRVKNSNAKFSKTILDQLYLHLFTTFTNRKVFILISFFPNFEP